MSLGWNDVEGLARGLHRTHSKIDPLTVRFVDLRSWAAALEAFEGDPRRLSPETLSFRGLARAVLAVVLLAAAALTVWLIMGGVP